MSAADGRVSIDDLISDGSISLITESGWEVAVQFQDGEVFTMSQLATGVGLFDSEPPVVVARKFGDDEWLPLGEEFLAVYDTEHEEDES